MKNENMKHLLAVYGTLRKGWGNHRLIQDCKFLGEQTISGFRMHSMGGFPAINKADENSTIKIEVYEITDPEVLRRVYVLESYTGKRDHPSNWYDTLDVQTEHGPAEIFYFKNSLEGSRPVIQSGIWT